MQYDTNPELERRLFNKLLDVLIKAGLILALVIICYGIFSPFLTLMLWALILAVTLYPAHQRLAARLGNRQGRAATLLVLGGIALIVVPTAILTSSLADTITSLIHDMRNNTLQLPLPKESVAGWPVIGDKLYAAWHMAATDLPAFIQSMQPKIGNIAKTALGMVASMGTGILQFILSFAIAGIIMAYGMPGHQSAKAISTRVMGDARGDEFATLCTATIRAVAMGVIGVAFIQAILLGLSVAIAGIPAPGLIALVALILGIAQIPAAVIFIPAVIYIWSSGDYATVPAIIYTVMLVASGLADNVLKPILLGRGVDAPMPIILLGALGGMVSSGILGMFVGATLLAIGYQVFMSWVAGHHLAPQGSDNQAAEPQDAP
ncbi:AI-2E family transporter [Aeromonas enteropelogenes]|uniref:AI-2E family transporter n=1 Tax=Aeromonas enteropelogenes TaxID=29489 RepID=UPI0005AB2F32|nr:AI-2E family transporter [Aeromonas enteropelogenes]UBH54544.1 AI-2E family transporter [Aeromonas enteropelogenes]